MNRLRAVGLAGLLAMIVAACSSGGSASPSASATPTATPAPPSVAPSDTTEGSASPSLTIPGVGDKHGAPELEATLPDTLGGQPLQKVSFGGDAFAQMGNTGDQPFKDFLERLNAKAEDTSVALAGGEVGGASVSITALQVKGTNGDTLENEFRSSVERDASQKLTWKDETVSGKSVVTTTDPSSADQGKLYAYAKGDTIFVITASDPAVAEEALSALP